MYGLGFSEKTITYYASILRSHDFYKRLAESSDPTSTTVEWLGTLRKEGWDSNSLATAVAVARSYARFIGTRVDVKVTRKLKLPSVPSPEDVEKLLSVAEGKDKLFIALMAFAGLRLGEVAKLNWSDVQKDYIVVRGKGGKTRIVPISQRLRDLLSQYKGEGSVFGVTTSALWYRFKRICRRAGVKTTPHKLRHFFATQLLQYTDIRTVQELLGHSSVATTQVYTHVADSRKFNAVKEAFG